MPFLSHLWQKDESSSAQLAMAQATALAFGSPVVSISNVLNRLGHSDHFFQAILDPLCLSLMYSVEILLCICDCMVH